MEKVTDWLGKETIFAYNRDSQIKATTFPASTANVDEYSYDKANGLTEVAMKKKAEVLASMSYTRDKIGQIEKSTEIGFPEVPEYKYEYDTRNRLTKSNGTTFGYDSANNVTKISSTTYTYDKADQIATASNATFEFNKLGQRVKETRSGKAATTYSYDQAGNLIAVESPELEKNTFKYDGTGLMATETKGASTYPMFWDSTASLPLLLRGGQDYFIYGPDGLPIEQITVGNALYLHHDQLGSTRVLTNPSGEVVGTYRYGPNGAFWQHTGTASTLMGWAGQRRLHTGIQLIYLRARTYDPETAQFLSVDPLVGIVGETYAYAADNPVNSTDPSGFIPTSSVMDCGGQSGMTGTEGKDPEPIDWLDYFRNRFKDGGVALAQELLKNGGMDLRDLPADLLRSAGVELLAKYLDSNGYKKWARAIDIGSKISEGLEWLDTGWTVAKRTILTDLPVVGRTVLNSSGALIVVPGLELQMQLQQLGGHRPSSYPGGT